MAKGQHSVTLFEVVRRNRPLTPLIPLNPKPLGTMSTTGALGAAPEVGSGMSGVVSGTTSGASGAGPGASPTIHLRFTYMTGFIAAMALFTMIAIGYLAGQRSVRRPALASEFGQNLLAGPAVPDVTRINNPAGDPSEVGDAPAVSLNTAQAPTAPSVPSVPATPAARTAGLNYVIIQSYPDQKMAEEAIKILHDGGIEATVEKLPNWSTKPSWVQVVGVTGFEKPSSPQFLQYQKKIQDISSRSSKRGSFRAFEPVGYKWTK